MKYSFLGCLEARRIKFLWYVRLEEELNSAKCLACDLKLLFNIIKRFGDSGIAIDSFKLRAFRFLRKNFRSDKSFVRPSRTCNSFERSVIVKYG